MEANASRWVVAVGVLVCTVLSLVPLKVPALRLKGSGIWTSRVTKEAVQ